jgi:hypothetical protein
MSPSSVPTDRSLACGLLVPLLWVLRKPLLGLGALVLRAAMALLMPTLLVLGIAKAWQLLAGVPTKKAPLYPGDSESLGATAAEVAGSAPVPPAEGI